MTETTVTQSEIVMAEQTTQDQDNQPVSELESWLKEKYEAMVKADKNIPFTKEEMARLPMGFTATGFLPTPQGPTGSKYMRSTKWSHWSQPWFQREITNLIGLSNLTSVINEKNLEVSD